MAEANLPALDACGFVRVPSDPGAEAKPLWLTCDRCGKSDNFWIADGQVHCRCGAHYDHAARPDGRSIPVSELSFVTWKEGPMGLADTEVDPLRVTLVILVLLGVLGGVAAGVWYALA